VRFHARNKLALNEGAQCAVETISAKRRALRMCEPDSSKKRWRKETLPPPLQLLLKKLDYFVTEVENAASRRDTASFARRTASSAPAADASACCAAVAA